ncbi:MAG: DASS family sodium-coupled anion symporter [Chitinophagaceae bacterium]|nr:DASS family sodium-coupled anion symporter [Chitinophagaceae bacterium]
MTEKSKQLAKIISLLLGIAISLFLYFVNPFGVEHTANKVLAVAGLMITWWVLEALPMPVVALLPLVLFPLLNISKLDAAASGYANPVIFLFMGGFMLGLAIEKWNLHRRIALNIVRLTGTSGDRIVLGFILATGLLSMWLSNTATTMMMFPIALSVIHVMKENNAGNGSIANFSLTIMLAIAYASNIGGIATIIGTPPNVAYIGYIEKKFPGSQVDFMSWMLLCTPLSLLLLLCLYWVMVKWLFPNRIKSDTATKELIRNEIIKLGPLSVAEKRVLIIFICTAFLWITRAIINDAQSLFKLDDTIIALLCALSLFICPSGKKEMNKEDDAGSILEWGDTSKMAWGILLLFGGGISLAGALENAGLIEQMGGWLAQFSSNGFVMVLVITVVTIFLSEVMSNVAQVIVFAPVVTSLAIALKMDPLLLGIPMTLAASCASMLPMGTPPNAIVFASGYIKLKHMTKAGLIMNIISIILITLFSWFLLPLLMRV